MAIAIRLAVKGYQVTVFEKNSYPGGKLSELRLGNYRFDKGPSLLTLPHLIDELTGLSGYPVKFRYTKLSTLTHYFFEDGTRLQATENIEAFARDLQTQFGEDAQKVVKHFKRSAFYYDTTAGLFLHQSLSQLKNFLNLKTLKGFLRAPRLNIFGSMAGENAAFKNEKTRQIFNRYATYNGSNPYRSPALLNMIPHLEFGLGAYLPEKGMHQITEYLHAMACYCGVSFVFGAPVESIILEKNKVTGLKSKGCFYSSDIVVSDVDIHMLYNKLLPQKWKPEKLLRQEKSSSAFVFYWGIKKEFKELDLHNIFFTQDYKEEFDCLFGKQEPYHDPTIYVNITSKLCAGDAPEGYENWFVMVNVPHNKSGNPVPYTNILRKNVLKKLNRMLNVNLEDYIDVEETLDPYEIEKQTSSFGGSLYGNAANSRFSAFLRHANYRGKLKGLYFVGGSVHPGGGIPLCLLSGKIAATLIEK